MTAILPSRAQMRRPATPDEGGTTMTLDRAALLRNGVFAFERADPRAAPFAMLRSQLLHRLDARKARVVAVTSARPRAGKSFVALNLAAALSRIYPTWLVDLDLRRPVVRERLELGDVASGVDAFLLGAPGLGEVRCVVGEQHLGVLPVDTPREGSAEILASDRTAQLFASLRAHPQSPVCVIDAPPMLEGDDMMILAPHLDGVLMVVEEGRTPQADLRETLRMLRPTPVVGTVLNRTILPQQPFGYGEYYPR